LWSDDRRVNTEDDLLLALKGRPVIEKIKVLYLVGAHKFQERELFSYLFPNIEKVYLFEPIPHLFASLENMLQNDTRFEVFPYAISDKNELSEFHVTNNEASSSLLPLGKHREIFPHVQEAQQITVECRRLEEVILQHHLQNPDMLFLDVQGAEYNILSSLSPDMRSNIYLIYTEASKEEIYVGAQTLDKIETLLSSDYIFLGFAPLTNWTPTHGNALFINYRFVNLIKDSTEEKLNRALSTITDLCSSGKFEEANLSIKKAIEQFPDSPDLLNLQAVFKLHTGDKEGAKSIAIDLIRRWPKYAPAYQNLAAMSLESGDYETASKYFEEALKLDKNNRETVFAHGNMLMSNKKYAKAKEVFEKYLTKSPDDNEIRALLQKCEGILRKVSKLGQVAGKIK
jgi:FkbM family methyltransferase